MASWISNFFDHENELADDVRNEYVDYLRFGVSGRAAARRLPNDFAEEREQSEYNECVFWMALAIIQWQYGRLGPKVKSRALAILKKGGDLQWYPPEAQNRRRRTLATVRSRLESPQPAERKVKVLKPSPPLKEIVKQWKTGQVVAFRRDSGRFALLLTEGVVEEEYVGQVPYFVVLKWSGTRLPSTPRIRSLRKGKELIGVRPNRKGSPIPWDRIERLDVFLAPTGIAQIDRESVYCEEGFDDCHWSELDSVL